MIEILLGIAAIVLAVIAIAQVKSSTDELKGLEEEVKKLSEAAEKSDEKTLKTIEYALKNKRPDVEDVGKIYREIGLPPNERAKIAQLGRIAEHTLYKDNTVHDYLQTMLKIAERAHNKEIPMEYANTTIRHMLYALDHKIRGIGGLTKGTTYVPRQGD
jgi:hypothetical protein